MPTDRAPDSTDIIKKIRRDQAHRPLWRLVPPKHEPEMLYIGCVDARLDPIDDIGIEKGKALIFRNIGATVFPSGEDRESGKTLDKAAIAADGTISSDISLGATLEFFLRHLPDKPGKVKHIVISGHTDCGGIKACSHACHKHEWDKRDSYLPRYLKPLEKLFTPIIDFFKPPEDEATLRELEKESVRKSIENLMSYSIVREAIAEHRVELHGWVIDTATGRISEMDHDTKEFAPMAAKEKEFTSLAVKDEPRKR